MLHFLSSPSASVATTSATIDQVGGFFTADASSYRYLQAAMDRGWWRFISLHTSYAEFTPLHPLSNSKPATLNQEHASQTTRTHAGGHLLHSYSFGTVL